MGEKQVLLRKIPKIDEVLRDERLIFFMEKMPRSVVVEAVREQIDALRARILEGKTDRVMSREQVADEALKLIRLRQKRNLRRVINATGIVLHTNLGRANLSERAIEGVCEAAAHYSTLEYDLKKGARGSRHSHVEEIIRKSSHGARLLYRSHMDCLK